MANITWILDIDGPPHSLRLEHGYYSGRRKFWLDDVLILDERRLVDFGSTHRLDLLGQEYEAVIAVSGAKVAYFLLCDGSPIPSEQDRQKGRSAEALGHAPLLGAPLFFRELGQALGLTCLPNPRAVPARRQRLLGFIGRYLVLLRQSPLSTETLAGWFVGIRHAPGDANLQAAIRSDPRIQALLGRRHKSPRAFFSDEQGSGITLPPIKDETPQALAQRVRSLLSVIAEYAAPLPTGVCENPECPQPGAYPRRLLLINGAPTLLCPACAEVSARIGEKNGAGYMAAPEHPLRGLAAGAGVALVAALLRAALIFLHNWTLNGFTDSSTPYSILLLLVWPALLGLILYLPHFILKVMMKAGARLTRLSLALAFLLTALSAILGILCGTALIPNSNRYIQGLKPLYLAALGMTALAFWRIWLEQKQDLNWNQLGFQAEAPE